MKMRIQLFGLTLLGACFFATAQAQTPAPAPGNASAPPSAPAPRSEADLEKLVAPIALYPDPLLATLLPASAYPIDIVQAARFIKDTNNISKVDSQSWDQNVKTLCQFPDVIKKMNDDLAWTSDLGQAFCEDQKSVLNAVQVMRGKAQQAGTLKTTAQQVIVVTNTVVEKTVEQQVVMVTNTVVQIQPAQPQVIYVPEYNPTVVYEPVPAYSQADVAATAIISFGVGMAVGAVIANNCNWHSGGIYVGPHGGGMVWGGGYHGGANVNINVNRNVNINNNNINNNFNRKTTVNNNKANFNRAQNNIGGGQKWQPDASRHTSAAATRATPENRGWSGQTQSHGSPHGSAFSNFGGGSQTRHADSRGSFSRGGSGGGGRSFGGFHRR